MLTFIPTKQSSILKAALGQTLNLPKIDSKCTVIHLGTEVPSSLTLLIFISTLSCRIHQFTPVEFSIICLPLVECPHLKSPWLNIAVYYYYLSDRFITLTFPNRYESTSEHIFPMHLGSSYFLCVSSSHSFEFTKFNLILTKNLRMFHVDTRGSHVGNKKMLTWSSYYIQV